MAGASATGSGTGALAVVRSTVTLRIGSGTLTGRVGPAGTGTGPDSNSGTINTMRSTKMDAPTRRSLTRRSIVGKALNVSGLRRRSIFGKCARWQQVVRLEPIERGPDDVE